MDHLVDMEEARGNKFLSLGSFREKKIMRALMFGGSTVLFLSAIVHHFYFFSRGRRERRDISDVRKIRLATCTI